MYNKNFSPSLDHTNANTKGHLRIFFGYAAGVGKMRAMLKAAKNRLSEGEEVVVACVEISTSQVHDMLLDSFEHIPQREFMHQGQPYRQMDIDAVLARHPHLVLVDNLAHVNAPNSRHPKRYQDVEELLAAGIDVYTTLNVYHLESLRDVVKQITGLAFPETVSDHIIERADSIQLIDMLPSDLLHQWNMKTTQSSKPEWSDLFEHGKLIALRELAMRQVADHIDHQMRAYMQSHAIKGPWAARECLMVAISPSPNNSRLVRTGCRMAQQLDAELVAVYVENPTDNSLDEAAQKRVNETLRLAETLGAKVLTITGTSVPDALMQVAHEHNVTKIIIGQTLRPRWQQFIRGSIVTRLIRMSGKVDVYVINNDDAETIFQSRSSTPPQPIHWQSYGYGIVIVLLATLLGIFIDQLLTLNPTNLVMVYLLSVVIASFQFGYGTAVFVSFLSVFAFNFSFVPPRYTLRVADTEYLLTFIGLGSVGIFTAYLASQLRKFALMARSREQQTARLYSLSRDLSTSVDPDAIIVSLVEHTKQILNCDVAVFLPSNGKLTITESTSDFQEEDTEQRVAQWTYEHQEPAGRGTKTMTAAACYYLPLKATKQTVGVVGIRMDQDLSPDQEHLINAFASQVALAIEAIQLAEQARQAELLKAKEKLQTAILNSVSHDLRTPLVSIKGTLSSLLEDGQHLTPTLQHELLLGAYDEADRMNRLVGNLLEISRLQSGTMRLTREPYEVEEIISVARNQVQSRLKDREVQVVIEPNLPFIKVDLSLFAQVIVNLLDNAAKYSSSSDLICIRAYQTHNSICICVQDNGIGIPQDEISRIFDKFFRASTTSSTAGSGLGLSIVKGIVELHGGTIYAANRTDKVGTIFTIDMPLSETLAIVHDQ